MGTVKITEEQYSEIKAELFLNTETDAIKLLAAKFKTPLKTWKSNYHDSWLTTIKNNQNYTLCIDYNGGNFYQFECTIVRNNDGFYLKIEEYIRGWEDDVFYKVIGLENLIKLIEKRLGFSKNIISDLNKFDEQYPNADCMAIGKFNKEIREKINKYE